MRREEEEAPPCIMSRDATSTAGAMAPLLVAALNPSNNTAIWSHDNDEEWSERERGRERQRETERRTTSIRRDRLSSNRRVCRWRVQEQHFIYLFSYNILIFISKLCKQISFLLSKSFGRNLKMGEMPPFQKAFGGNFSKLSPEKKIKGKIKKLSSLNILIVIYKLCNHQISLLQSKHFV